MPVYVYECKLNGHRFEVRQGVNDPPVQVCQDCGEAVRRVILPVGIVFKGSGFYATDSRNSNAAVKPVDSSSSNAKSDPDSTTSTKSEGTSKEGSAKESKPAADAGSTGTSSSAKSETPAAS